MNDLLLVILLGVVAAAIVFGIVYGSGAAILRIVRWRRDARLNKQTGEAPPAPVAEPALALPADVGAMLGARASRRAEEEPQQVAAMFGPKASRGVEKEPEQATALFGTKRFPRRAGAPQTGVEAVEPQGDAEPIVEPQTGAERQPAPEPVVMLSESELEDLRQDPELQATVERAQATDVWHTEAVGATTATDAAEPSADVVEAPVEEPEPVAEAEETHYPSGEADELPQIPQLDEGDEPEVPDTANEPEPAADQAYGGLKVDPFAALRASMNRR